MNGEESTVEKMEMHNVTTSDRSDEVVSETEDNTAINKRLLSMSQETDTPTVSDRDIGESTASASEYWDRIIQMLDTDSGDTVSDCIGQILESANETFLDEILDYCLDSNDDPNNSEELMATLKYRALLNMAYFLLESDHKDLLKHPALSIFINLIWKKLKCFFFINVFFYVTFLASLTAYILFSEFCNTQINRDVANITNDLNLNNSNLTCGMIDERRYIISQFLWYALMILLGLLCLREMCQLLIECTDYIKSKKSWLILLLISVTFTSCSGTVDIIKVNRHLFAIAILLGWFELLLLLGRLPLLSVQTEMLKTVSVTFLKVMPGYMVLIMAFAFSFYILFKEDVQGDDVDLFINPLISILKTIVMFAGEFDASHLPFDTLIGTSHVIFLLFVFFVAIVLLNLLNGLAVGDTRRVKKKAETLSLVARVRLITNILGVYLVLPSFVRNYLGLSAVKTELFPNKTNTIGPDDLRNLKRIITEKREGNTTETKTELVVNGNLLTEELSTLKLESKEMRQKLSKLELQSEKTQQMLKKIVTHLNIPES
jgi:hypothetical protein